MEGISREVPSVRVYGSATPGPMNDYSIGVVSDQGTWRSKGQQGILILGSLLSKYQHYKAEDRDMHREALVIGQRGVVRTSDKWAWHSGHFTDLVQQHHLSQPHLVFLCPQGQHRILLALTGIDSSQ